MRPRFGTHRSAAYKVFGILFKHFGDLAMSHPVDDDPIMASAIGRCSNNWTHAESVLSWIFCHLTDTTPTVAVTVFSFFKATRTQRDVLRKLGKMTPFMTEDLNSRLKGRIENLYCTGGGAK